ncbi:T9SS type A sorting domain-containing protein [Corallibacter sp.]|uniref:T9SS type A sorting domain-containing protein n=1 Tax=Corallibacter sp. TaxID=2038084 RepID=UPI003A8D3CA3
MKTKLLIAFFLISIYGFSQAPINNFNSANGLRFAVVTSSGAVNQSASGAGLTWNFNDLATAGTVNEDTYVAPTTSELSSYPGTTSVLTITDVSNAANTNKIFQKIETGAVSLTGVERDDLVLNYTNNALVGSFPMSYNASNSDPVSGSFTYTTFSGTFTGTLQVSVDAYGTLNMNDIGEGAYSGSVTRLKIEQSLTLVVPFFGSVPATQTSYYYYDNNDDNLVFRTNNFVVNLLSVNETIMEAYLPLSLSTHKPSVVSDQVRIIPSIVTDVLQVKSQEAIQVITVTDLNGRVVLISENSATLSVNQLATGIYVASIKTQSGEHVQKFIKK